MPRAFFYLLDMSETKMQNTAERAGNPGTAGAAGIAGTMGIAGTSRMVGLDIFRVMAVLVVLMFHTKINHGCDFGVADGFIRMGAIFMTGFFMLSGFVLFANYSGKNVMEKGNLKQFYLKRLIGIFPLYFFVSMVYMIFCSSESLKQNLLLFPVETLGLQSHFSSLFDVSHNSGTWFISSLFFCYLLFPLMQEVTKQISNKVRIIAIVLCSFMVLWAPLIVHTFSTAGIYDSPVFRALEFFIGVLLCSLLPSIKDRPKLAFMGSFWTFLGELAVLFGVVTFAVSRNIAVGNYSVYSIIALPIFILMILTLSMVKSEKLSNSKVLNYAAKISFAVFLAQTFNTEIENFIFTKLEIANLGAASNGLKILIPFIVCGILAVAMHHLVEKPCGKFLKKKLL